jgi:hypothetical protein
MNLDMLPVKLALFIILFWPISRVWLRFKDGSVKLGAFLFWTGVWFVGVFVIFFPGLLTYFANLIGIGRGADVAMYGAIVVLFYLVFRISVMLENIRHDISKIVREVALLEKKKKRK